MKLSVVATLYGTEPFLQEFYTRASKIAAEYAGEDYELILVNDGSPDRSLDMAVALANEDARVRVIDLSRNFGHHYAIMAGLAQSSGEHVFLIDSDLEEEPEWLPAFSQQMQSSGADVVFGVQKRRKGGPLERFNGWLFYTLFNNLTGVQLPRNAVTARLMTRQYVDALLLHDEREISIGGLFYITGFRQEAHVVTKHDTSESVYNLRHKLAIVVNSVVSFSSRPLVTIFFLGLTVFLLSLIVSFYFVINAVMIGEPPDGWTSLIVSVWMLGGLIISCIGVVGIYISKIYTETKQRPKIIIRDIYQKQDQ
jgi:putative glycosyltransferase